MDSVLEFLVDSAGVIVFCAALGFFFLMANNSDDMITRTNEVLNDDRYLAEDPNFVYRDKGNVTAEELVAIMMIGFDTDITIDGTIYRAEGYSPYTFNFSSISSEYTVEQQIDADGNVIMVVYTRV